MGAPTAAWSDREIVLAAVARDGAALALASTKLRSDRDIVLEAVASNWQALRHVPEEHREIVLAATEGVKHNSCEDGNGKGQGKGKGKGKGKGSKHGRNDILAMHGNLLLGFFFR